MNASVLHTQGLLFLVATESSVLKKALTDREPSGWWSLANFVVSRNLDLVDGGPVKIVDVQLGHCVVDPDVSTKPRIIRTQVNLRYIPLSLMSTFST